MLRLLENVNRVVMQMNCTNKQNHSMVQIIGMEPKGQLFRLGRLLECNIFEEYQSG
jgi:hypothetical protein